MAKIILHADDFGFDKDTVGATIELFEKSALTSATIMATCPAADVAIRYAKEHPRFSFGAHLTFVDGLKPAAHNPGCSLLANGVFEPSNTIRKKAMLLNINTLDIIEEIKSQVKIIEDGGIKLSHLDSHGHLHKFPAFLCALKLIKNERPDMRVRRPQTLFINPQKVGPIRVLNKVFDWYIAHNFKTTDHFYMPANSMDTDWSNRVLSIIDRLPDNTIVEVGVHPGHQEDWRQHEFNDICEFADKIRMTKHQVINWNNV